VVAEAFLNVAACLWFSEIRLPLDKATYLTKVCGYQVLDQKVAETMFIHLSGRRTPTNRFRRSTWSNELLGLLRPPGG